MKKHYFISGLPRSGSTLLTAILNQNPNFYSDIASPLQDMLENTITYMSETDYSININSKKRENVLKHIVEGYYKDTVNETIFDSSRAWTGNTSLLKSLFPYTKIICCVRDINWILDSFEKVFNKNIYYKNFFFGKEAEPSVVTRCKSLMDVEKEGQVIKPWLWLKEGLCLNKDMIHLIEYNDLCLEPEKTIKGVYDFIGYPYFYHDFNNVEYSNNLFDLHINTPNLHKVTGKVEYKPREILLPYEVTQTYKGMEFWRK